MICPMILVVEDEAVLRLAAMMMIEDAGLTVAGARNAEEAIALLEEYPDIRLIFTDIDMGSGKDGLWLASQVRDRWPPVHIIVTSAHYNVTKDMMPSGALFFAKPYAEDDVMEEIKRLAA